MRTEIIVTARQAAVAVRILQKLLIKSDSLVQGKETDIEALIDALAEADRIVIGKGGSHGYFPWLPRLRAPQLEREEAGARLVHFSYLDDLFGRKAGLERPLNSIASATLMIARELGKEIVRRHERAL